MGNEFSQLHASAGFLGFVADIKNTTSCHLLYQTPDNESEMCWPLHVLSSFCQWSGLKPVLTISMLPDQVCLKITHRWASIFLLSLCPIFSFILLSSYFSLFLLQNLPWSFRLYQEFASCSTKAYEKQHVNNNKTFWFQTNTHCMFCNSQNISKS